MLGCPADRADMIVGEVKDGAARFNAAIRDPLVLELGLARFGCCEPAQAADLVRRLLAAGEVTAGTSMEFNLPLTRGSRCAR